MQKNKNSFPVPVIRRLSKYYGYLERADTWGRSWISSKELAKAVGLTRSTVRMDISHLDFSGVCKKGYPVDKLVKALKKTLYLTNECNVVLVGAGNIGKAITLHKEFQRKGFYIKGIFDSDKKLQGKKVGKLIIQDLSKLKKTVEEKNILLGIIAVPSESAQTVADKLIQAGVSGLLNLCCAQLIVPEHITVVESRIAIDLCELCCTVKMQNS
jgi:redox-sensing transcriptional repressor